MKNADRYITACYIIHFKNIPKRSLNVQSYKIT